MAARLRPITEAEATADYLAFTEAVSFPPHSRLGNVALDRFFFPHRLITPNKSNTTFMAVMGDPVEARKLEERTHRIGRLPAATSKNAHRRLRALYYAFQMYYGAVNQFRAPAAAAVYAAFRPRVGVLDFSAGWGGRCLAAMAAGIPYTGIDANVDLAHPYKAMIAAYAPTAPVNMLFQPAETVDFAAFDYDLVFTSPPYYMLEKYSHMPAYGTKREFADRFFVPVVRAAWRHLRRGGHMVLNMPAAMLRDLEAGAPELPPVADTLPLTLANKHPMVATRRAHGSRRRARTSRIGAERPRTEAMFVWRKA